MGGVGAITTIERKPAPEHLPCPRCSSINTKFCYYNNYNFSQPRHFCKSCRRYWTHGGTLRDIPVGGGTRKSAKRSRAVPSSEELRRAPPGGSFTSLLNSNNSNTHGAGVLGLGFSLDDVGFGLGRPLWPLYGIAEGGVSAVAAHGDGGNFAGGECFPFADIAAIPAPGSFFK